jgi:hypothetical protein
MEAKLALIVVESCVKLMSPVDAAPIDDHDDLCAGCAARGHHLVEIWAQLLGITVGHDFREDWRGAIVDGADDAEHHAAGDATPGAIRQPRLAFEGLLAFDLALAQGTYREADALGGAPPAHTGQGKTPQDGFVFIE